MWADMSRCMAHPLVAGQRRLGSASRLEVCGAIVLRRTIFHRLVTDNGCIVTGIEFGPDSSPIVGAGVPAHDGSGRSLLDQNACDRRERFTAVDAVAQVSQRGLAVRGEAATRGLIGQ